MGDSVAGDKSRGDDKTEHKLSYLDVAIDGTVGRVARSLHLSKSATDDAEDLSHTVIDGVFMFAPGRKAIAGAAVIGALEGAKPGAALNEQIFDATAHAVKNVAVKQVFEQTGKIEMASSMRGVTIGTVSRSFDVLYDRQNYYDKDGQFSLGKALGKTVTETLDPAALRNDALVYGASDFLEGEMNLRRGGAFRRSTNATTLLSAGAFGATQSGIAEVARERSENDSTNFGKILYKGALGSTGSMLSALPSALMNRRAFAHSESRAFENKPGRIELDAEQIKLRDGEFTAIKKLDGIDVESHLGHVTAADGSQTAVIFRVHDQSAKFESRMQAETSNYLLSNLMGFHNAEPITVPRSVVIGNQTVDGYVQAIQGKGFDTAIMTLAQQKFSNKDNAAKLAAINESPALLRSVQEGILRRQVGSADHDAHALNMTLAGAEQYPRVGNIDLQFSFNPVRRPNDLKPHWEKAVSMVSDFGGVLRKEFAGKPIPESTRTKFAGFLEDVKTDPDSILKTGLSSAQARGVLGRTQYVVDTGLFPQSHPNYVHESVVRFAGRFNKKPQPDLETGKNVFPSPWEGLRPTQADSAQDVPARRQEREQKPDNDNPVFMPYPEGLHP